MKTLKAVRWILAALFLLLAVLWVFSLNLPFGLPRMAEKVQIVPSLIAVCIGAVIFWLIITIVYGRIYCATVCPVGTLTDLAYRLRRLLPSKMRHFRYRRDRKLRYHILIIYLICLIAGLAIIPALIEPWNLFRNIFSLAHPEQSPAVAALPSLAAGIATGIAAGIFSLLLIAVAALFTGRGFCTDICPVGTLLSLAASSAVYRIEIDPDKCSACMKCEERCPAGCIKIVGRYVDDRRCVRCMECVTACPDKAIRYQRGRNRVATPMMRRIDHSASGK